MGPHKKPRIYPVDPGRIIHPEVKLLNNGIPVHYFNSGAQEFTRIEFVFDAGTLEEDFPLQASATNLMLGEGSVNFSSTEVKNIMDFYGTTYSLNHDKDRAGLLVHSLNRHLDKVLEICNTILFYPQFPERELKTLMRKRHRNYLISSERVSTMVWEQFFESLFGHSHAYGRKVDSADYMRITKNMIVSFHDTGYHAGKLAIIAAGKLPDNFFDLMNNHFGELQVKDIYKEDSSNIITENTSKKVTLQKKGSVQSAIIIGSKTISRYHADYPGLEVLNMVLGGYFGSRLMQSVREGKGYTYDIFSGLASMKEGAYKAIFTEVNCNQRKETLSAIYDEISRLQQEPVPIEELNRVRRYMLGDLLRSFDGPFAKAESLRNVFDSGLDNSYYEKLTSVIKTTEPDEIMRIAQTYYKIEDLHEITAG